MQALVQMMQKKEKSLTAQEAFLLARCHGECGNVGAAISVIERPDRLPPSAAAKLYLAGLCVDSGQSSKCLELVESLENVHASCEGLYLKAAALRRLDRPAEALLAVNRAIQLRPCNADYQLEKGKILEALSRYGGALNQYTKAIRVHPQNPEALFRRGLLRSKVGERAGAIEDLERCHYYQNTRTEAYLLAEKLKTVRKANLMRPEQGQMTSCQSRGDCLQLSHRRARAFWRRVGGYSTRNGSRTG
jgi:tetratricopeptide (TPR) repeat protein